MGDCYVDSCSEGGVCLYNSCKNIENKLVAGFISSGGSSQDFIYGKFLAAFKFGNIKFPANFDCAENAIVSIFHNGNDGF